MKNTIILIICNFATIFLHAQQISGNFTIKSETFSSVKLDKCIQNFYFQSYTTPNIENPNNKREAQYILQIGKDYSKFTELNVLKQDSISSDLAKLTTVGVKELNNLLKYKVYSKKVLIKNNINGKYTIQDIVNYKYQYEDTQPIFNWKLENETKKILNYLCKKATTEYRGRKYIAWYSTEISINNGPFIFSGLPGFIMEIYSKDNEFKFTLNGINNKGCDIYIRNEKNIINVNREKFREIEKNYHENPSFYMQGKVYDAPDINAVSNFKMKSIPYNPIELE